MIELLELSLRGDDDAERAARRAARTTARYLTLQGSRDVAAVVAECVGWLAGEHAGGPRRPLRLELSASSTVVQLAITDPNEVPVRTGAAEGADALHRALPATTALASRYRVEMRGRRRVCAEFDRPPRR